MYDKWAKFYSKCSYQRFFTKLELSMVQILILAAVAAFLFWRLSLVLGIRSGFEKTVDLKISKPSPIAPDDKENANNTIEDQDISDYVELSSNSGQQLKIIKSCESNFSVQNFISGAKSAYEIILMAFEKGDLNVLENHLSFDVYEDFKAVVSDRANNGYSVDANFIGLREIRIRNVLFDQESMEAEITVFFKCELTSVVRDKSGEVVEGSSTKVKSHTDVWTFCRKIGTDDPAWKVIATGE